MQPGSPVATPTTTQITGWILAGGQGLRMDGADKGLQLFQGQPLVQHSLERLRPQVNTVCINANRHGDHYRAWGCEVFPDTEPGFAGPLMGFLTGLEHCPTEWLAVVPCDSPLFPLDLVSRLADAAQDQQALIAVVNAPETDRQGHTALRAQPVFCLLHRSLKDSLRAFLNQGGRKIDAWTSQHPLALVDFTQSSSGHSAFANANTWADLQTLEQPPA